MSSIEAKATAGQNHSNLVLTCKSKYSNVTFTRKQDDYWNGILLLGDTIIADLCLKDIDILALHGKF